jgi:hypothetical protein
LRRVMVTLSVTVSARVVIGRLLRER